MYYNWGQQNSSLGYLPSDPSLAADDIVKMANPDLGWERTTQYNLGIDYGFLNNRLTGSIDAYKTNK